MKGIPVEITLSIFISGTRSSEGMMGIKTKATITNVNICSFYCFTAFIAF